MSKNTDVEYWNKMQSSQSFISWAGYAFENVCLKHIVNIKKALGITSVSTLEYHFSSKGTKDDKGAEIDLIIDRKDGCIHLCEIKFSSNEFVISSDYAKKLETKKAIFYQKTKTKKSLFITMITPYGVKKNENYIGLVDQEITLEDLF
jgi:uncharacterized protein